MKEESQRQKRQESVPLYIAIPTVRRTIVNALPKWFIHAWEARIKGKPEAEFGLLAQALNLETDPTLRQTLEKLKKRLRQRLRPIEDRYEHPIHFIVVDNSTYHPTAAALPTHTPEIAQLASALNRIGNRLGIYIHCITPNVLASWMPENQEKANPYWHWHEGRLRMSPGGAVNIALSYALGWHQQQEDNGLLRVLKLDDDINPSQGKFVWRSGPRDYRNFFFDQMEMERQGIENEGFFRGYHYGTQNRTHGNEMSDMKSPIIQMLETKPEELRFANTSFGEDLTPFRYQRLPIPSYLIHSGRTSTYAGDRKGNFGSYKHLDIGPVRKATAGQLREVARESGLQITQRK